jgi:hypothetical protein
MNILFPDAPLDPTKVDPDFADQADAATAALLPWSLVSFEALVHEDAPGRAVRRVPEGAGPCLYRGWMLKPAAYASLAAALARKGAPLLVTPDAYEYAHHLPGWYPDFRDVTARTVWTTSADPDAAREALKNLPDGPAVVKDYVKSAKHRWKEACFIPDVRDEVAAMNVICEFLAEQEGDLNGGVVLRTFRPYPSRGVEARTGMPLIDERRLFLWRGEPLAIIGDERALLQAPALRDAIARLRSPFVSLDLARLADGTWEVVEVGDGQVSGLRDLALERFFGALRTAVSSGS